MKRARTDHTVRLVGLSLTLLAAALLLLRWLPTPDLPDATDWTQALVLVAAFALCEGVVLHFDIGDEAYTASISEIPLVAGLLLLDPALVVGARVVGAVLALWLWRRQPPIKLLFNTCSFLLEAAVPAVLITHLPMQGLEGWAAITFAAILGNITSGLSVSAAIALTGIAVRPSHLGRLVAEAAVFAGFSSTVAVLGVAAYRFEPGMLTPILIASLGLSAMYVGSTRMRSRLRRLTALQTAIRDFTPAAGYDETVRALLEQARDKLRAGSAVLQADGVRFTYDGTALRKETGSVVHLRTVGAGAVLRRAHELAAVGLAGVDEAVAVPISGGFLAVCERRSDHTVFSPEDRTALQGIAQHGAVSLANALLIERLLHESRHDALTGLPNRVLFHEQPYDEGSFVLLADLDGFKEVNDALGHQTGDLLLQHVAARLLEALPEHALLARLGGDEFAVLLHLTPSVHAASEAMAVAEQLRKALALPLRIQDVPISVGASIGISQTEGSTVAEVLRRADVAMYTAKSGTGIALYDAALDKSDATKLSLAGELREGVRRGELRLHVQPKARASDGVTLGVEALVRWQHPVRGLIYPDEFIGLAERTGILGEISAWVLASSLDALQTWRLAGHDLTMSINMSPQDLHDPLLPARVASALAARDLAADLLILEITEGTIMTDPDRVRGVLVALREQGVRISVDDFGTGHSSLAYLGSLPVDEVKVDKTFVQDVLTDRGHRAVVFAVTRIAHDLDLVVVAEGVEDLATWQHLDTLGCHQIQGYHLARPMPAAALPGWLAAQQSAPAAAEPRALRSVTP